MLERRRVGSMILWGPPGSGKTTIARLIAAHTDRAFVPFSAVTEGVPRVREIVGEAAERWRAEGRGTILFVDEIHRFNRGQQDAFLPHVETGTVTLVGATTENPSFELVGALLSRARVFVLEALGADDVAALLRRALADPERGLGALGVRADDDAVALLAEHADGDARRALTALEAAADLVAPAATSPPTWRATRCSAACRATTRRRGALQPDQRLPQGAAWQRPAGRALLARADDRGGRGPALHRPRTVRFASEDVGLADPEALRLAVAARDAYQFLGSPEGELALAEAAVYLATAPKSNRVYEGWKAALAAARETPAAPVPHHLRNAPTRLMKDLGYGAGYQYAHAVPEAYTPQEYLPDALRGAEYYAPGPFGFEREVGKRLAWWRELRARLGGGGDPPPAPGGPGGATSSGGDGGRRHEGTPAPVPGGAPLGAGATGRRRTCLPVEQRHDENRFRFEEIDPCASRPPPVRAAPAALSARSCRVRDPRPAGVRAAGGQPFKDVSVRGIGLQGGSMVVLPTSTIPTFPARRTVLPNRRARRLGAVSG
jgi:putative ATPase